MKRKRPTQADVARLAGVSQSTVSMVLNQRDGGSILFSEDTVKRVTAAMLALGYAPDPVAQMLAQGQNRLLAVFNYDPASSYLSDGSYHKILVGVENGADEQDYNILLLTRGRTHAQRSIFHGGVNTLRLADGAIIMGLLPNHDELRRLANESYPFVYVGRREVENVEFDWVISDYYSAGVQATEHLLQLNHRRLGYICERAFFDTHSSQARWNGCLATLAGTPDVELILIDQTEIEEPAGLLALLRDRQISALVCNDAGNFSQAMQTLSQLPLRIPDDISILVLGDTLGDFATSMNVTYVRLNQEMVGGRAVSMLTARIDSGAPPEPRHTLIPCDFVIGETTGPFKAKR